MKGKAIVLLAVLLSLNIPGNYTASQCIFEIATPQDGEVVSGTVMVTIHSTCPLDTVILYINGVRVPEYFEPPVEYEWDTCKTLGGSFTIFAVGYYDKKLQGMDTNRCTVSNIQITNPVDNELVTGVVTLTSNSPCAYAVLYYIDGIFIGAGYPPFYQCDWNTCPYENLETYTIKALRYYKAKGWDFDEITVIVMNPDYYDCK